MHVTTKLWIGSFTVADLRLRRRWPEAGVREFVQLGLGFSVNGFGGFDQAVNLPAGDRTLGFVAEQPVLAADYKGPYGALDSLYCR